MGQTGRISAVIALVIAAVIVAGGASVSGGPPPKQIALSPLGVYRTMLFDQAAAETAAYDAATRRVFVTNVALRRIDVIDVSDPGNPTLAATLDVTPFGSHSNSVAVHDGVVITPQPV